MNNRLVGWIQSFQAVSSQGLSLHLTPPAFCTHILCSVTSLSPAHWHHTLHVIFHPSNHRRAQYPLVLTQLKVLWPTSTLSAMYQFPLPAPLSSCHSPWTVILRRHDIDRHINQRLSIALPPMPSSSELPELQFLSSNGTESHTSLSSFFIIGLKPSYIRPPWCLDLTHLIKLLSLIFFFPLDWQPILEKMPRVIKVSWAETLPVFNITNSCALFKWVEFSWCWHGAWQRKDFKLNELRISRWDWHVEQLGMLELKLSTSFSEMRRNRVLVLFTLTKAAVVHL